jgi:hypothetical protein
MTKYSRIFKLPNLGSIRSWFRRSKSITKSKASTPTRPPLGSIEPHAGLLKAPVDSQTLYKVISVENFLRSVSDSYLYFNRVDSYSDISGGDPHDGEALPMDRRVNELAKFAKAPQYSIADYYVTSRARTYASCFSLENSEYIWRTYGKGGMRGKVGIVFVFDKLRSTLNGTMQPGASALEYNGVRCHQIFNINYGIVEYVDWEAYQSNLKRLPNPIQYTYLKDKKYHEDRELRIALSTIGMGKFVMNDGTPMEFVPNFHFGFDFRKAFSDGTIQEIAPGPDCDTDFLLAELEKLHVMPRFPEQASSG